MKLEQCTLAVMCTICIICVFILSMEVVNYSGLKYIDEELQILEGSVIHD